MEIAYKYRLYPNEQQAEQIERTLGSCRYVYNHYLDRRQRVYKETQKTFNYYDCAKDLTAMKRYLPWLKEVDATALQSALRDLDNAYQNFFRNLKKGKKPAGFPKFKKKHSSRQSYTSKCVGTNIKVLDVAVQLPKLGIVPCRITRPIQGRILSATVSRTSSGKYFVSLCCRLEQELPKLPPTGKIVGLDMGIHSFVVSSDGIVYENHKYLARAEKRLDKAQRQLSRKTKGSRRRAKALRKVARLHEKVTNQRKDTLHKLTTDLIRGYDTICIEDLAPGNMVKNHRLAKAISDAAWGEFRRQLLYKAEWYGRKIIMNDRFYPSSQLCGACGYQWPGTKDLSVRRWVCPNCGAEHDRDRNAANNILLEGIRQMA